MNRTELVKYLDDYLEIDKIPDSSQNGLQVEGSNTIRLIGAAVDACQDAIEAAAKVEANLLLVHHGLLWDKPVKVTGNNYRRLRALITANINLYCAHLPLDWHPEVGNNAVLARQIGFEPITGFGPSGAKDGRSIGCIAIVAESINSAEFIERVAAILGEEVRADFFGPKQIRRIAIVSGGGSSLLPLALAEGVDALVTGEPKHSFYHFSKENGINVIYGGHYNTETFGVTALAEHLEKKFNIPYQFFHFPTGL